MADDAPRACDTVVSFDHEPLILVDADDHEIGYLAKADAHLGSGTLHRAFSLFVFDARGRLLIQRRADSKRLWPGYWSNTCCSHPRRGERIETAIHRRLGEELNLRSELQFLFKFRYQAQFDDRGGEHELCHVYAGQSGDTPTLNRHEVSELRYVAPDHLDNEMDAHPELFTPWFKLEWARMRNEHARWWAAA